MGFKMDDVHAPTVVSGDASSTNKIHNDSPDNVNLLHLVRDRDRMESELWALGSVLESVRLYECFQCKLLTIA